MVLCHAGGGGFKSRRSRSTKSLLRGFFYRRWTVDSRKSRVSGQPFPATPCSGLRSIWVTPRRRFRVSAKSARRKDSRRLSRATQSAAALQLSGRGLPHKTARRA